MPRHRRWDVQLSEAAQNDVRTVTEWTARIFGQSQALTYANAIKAMLRALRRGPDIPGSRVRPDLGESIHLVSIRIRPRRRGRHVLVYRPSGNNIVILRILHDSMDFGRHLADVPEDKPE